MSDERVQCRAKEHIYAIAVAECDICGTPVCEFCMWPIENIAVQFDNVVSDSTHIAHKDAITLCPACYEALNEEFELTDEAWHQLRLSLQLAMERCSARVKRFDGEQAGWYPDMMERA